MFIGLFFFLHERVIARAQIVSYKCKSFMSPDDGKCSLNEYKLQELYFNNLPQLNSPYARGRLWDASDDDAVNGDDFDGGVDVNDDDDDDYYYYDDDDDDDDESGCGRCGGSGSYELKLFYIVSCLLLSLQLGYMLLLHRTYYR